MIKNTHTVENIAEVIELLDSLEHNYDLRSLKAGDWVERSFFVTEDEEGIVQIWSEDNTHLYWTCKKIEEPKVIEGITTLVIDDWVLAEPTISRVIEAKIDGDSLIITTERGIRNPEL